MWNRALRQYEIGGDQLRSAHILQMLSLVERQGTAWSHADSLLAEALRMYGTLGAESAALTARLNLSSLRLFRGQFLLAEPSLKGATALAEELNEPARGLKLRTLRALLFTRTGRPGAARTEVVATLAGLRSQPDPRTTAALCEYTGEFRLAGGYLSRARRWLQRGYALAYRIPERDIMGETQRLLAEVEFQSKNPGRALELAEESLAAFEKMEDLYEVAVCRRVRGGILLHLGRTAEAIHDLERAVDFFTQMGERFEIYRAQRLLALARGEAIDDADTLIATLGRSYDAEGARLRAELEANEVDPIADLLNQPFPADAGRFPAGSRGADGHGADTSSDTDTDTGTADTRDPAANTDPTRVSPTPPGP
ncbi:MAG: tetratricopeptide repeat protein [Candidatus Eisenbacteria bacterium]|nr:tetratricopeptide repeat protein [Candidatus Eisenbacteria bacterium]